MHCGPRTQPQDLRLFFSLVLLFIRCGDLKCLIIRALVSPHHPIQSISYGWLLHPFYGHFACFPSLIFHDHPLSTFFLPASSCCPFLLITIPFNQILPNQLFYPMQILNPHPTHHCFAKSPSLLHIVRFTSPTTKTLCCLHHISFSSTLFHHSQHSTFLIILTALSHLTSSYFPFSSPPHHATSCPS